MHPLLAAYNGRHIDAMELLLEHGANYDMKLGLGWRWSPSWLYYRMETLIDMAIVDQYIPAIKLLLPYL